MSTAAVTPAALRTLLDGDHPPRLIDVRTPEDFRAAHIPGSRNVPLEVISDVPLELLTGDPATDVVLVCHTGRRAKLAERLLTATGMTKVRVLDGGLVAWRAAGAPVTRGRVRWSIERQVRLIAGGLVVAAILVSVWLPDAKWFAGFVGAGLAFAGITNICGLGMLLARLPWNRVDAAAAPTRQLATTHRARE